MNEEFSVYWWDTQGDQHEELRYVTAERAFPTAADGLRVGGAS